jgi:hypothetical protein
MKAVIEEHYPEAEFLRVVQDNLNTHSPAAFYEAFPAAEAFALAQRLEPHYTPKKGSWLNMAEIELAALAKQCLDRRIGDMETLAKGNRTPGVNAYRATSGGDVSGRSEGAGVLQMAAVQAVVK